MKISKYYVLNIQGYGNRELNRVTLNIWIIVSKKKLETYVITMY